MKTEGQGPDLITTDQQNFLRIYQWEDTLRNKRRFLPCYSSKISCSYLSFDVLPVISPLIWLIQSSPPATPPSSCLRNLLYVCHMKCPDRCPGEPVRPLVERGTGEREKQKKRFVQVFGASRSGEVMIVSVPFAFQVHSLQQLVKLETELARRTGCRAQVKQLVAANTSEAIYDNDLEFASDDTL